jgi:hypothetical protein
VESSQIGTNKISKDLIDKNNQIEHLTQCCSDYVYLHQRQQKEIADLKKQLNDYSNLHQGICYELLGAEEVIELLKNRFLQLTAENTSMSAYAEQRINMLTRANRKLGGES